MERRTDPQRVAYAGLSLVSVRVQPAREAFQESLRMLRFSGGLVLIQYNGLFRAAAGAVQPHIGLAGRGTSRLFQHLQGRLVRVQHRLPAKLLMQHIVDRPQPLHEPAVLLRR